jgi:RNA polymerase sigma-70 factor (ECF subfamily)
VRLDALRRETRRFTREERWSKERSWISESPEHCQSDDVRWAVQHLPETLRDVIELGVYQDLPYAEISEILSIPVGTVKSRMFNALKKLKEIFDDEGPEKSTR